MIAQEFSLKQLGNENGELVSLEDFKGKAIMLTFWASWCPDCAKDLHVKNHFYCSLNSDELVFLTINVTGREASDNAARQFMGVNDYSFPVLIDEGTKTYDAYHCYGVPTTFLLNKNHEIVATFNDKARFTDILKKLGDIL